MKKTLNAICGGAVLVVGLLMSSTASAQVNYHLLKVQEVVGSKSNYIWYTNPVGTRVGICQNVPNTTWYDSGLQVKYSTSVTVYFNNGMNCSGATLNVKTRTSPGKDGRTYFWFQ